MQDEEESVAPAPGDVDRRPSSTSTGGGSVAGGGGGSQSGSATCGGGYSGDCSSNGSTAWSSSDNSTESHSGKRARRGEVTADDGGNKVSVSFIPYSSLSRVGVVCEIDADGRRDDARDMIPFAKIYRYPSRQGGSRCDCLKPSAFHVSVASILSNFGLVLAVACSVILLPQL